MSGLLAGTTDLAVRLGGVEVEDAQLQAALEDISALARYEARPAGALWSVDWTEGDTATTAVPPSVRVVVLDAARRRLLNPEGYVSEQVGDYAYRRAEGTEGDSAFTDDELRKLHDLRHSGTGLRGFGSIRVERPGLLEAAYDEVRYLPTNMQGDPLPWPNAVSSD